MSELTVVYLKDTGHVLAALTRADPPAGAEPVSDLVNKGLPVSTIDGTPADVILAATYLAAVTIDDDQPEVLINPQNFQVIQDPQGQAPPRVKNVGVPGSTVTLTLSAASGATVTVTGVPSATSLPAVVVLQKVTSPSLAPTILAPVTVPIGSGGTVVSDQTGFAVHDTWNMLAFVQGLQPVASGVKTL
jgi:hypothetical protein